MPRALCVGRQHHADAVPGGTHRRSLGVPCGGIAMHTGTVKWFDPKRGFGFIIGSGAGRDVFVHYTSIRTDGFRTLKDGEAVQFELVESEKGLQAHDVRRLDAKSQQRS